MLCHHEAFVLVTTAAGTEVAFPLRPLRGASEGRLSRLRACGTIDMRRALSSRGPVLVTTVAGIEVAIPLRPLRGASGNRLSLRPNGGGCQLFYWADLPNEELEEVRDSWKSASLSRRILDYALDMVRDDSPSQRQSAEAAEQILDSQQSS